MTLSSRQRLQKTLNHQTPDRVCIDFGATAVTGIAASALSRLRRAVLGQNDYRIKIIEPYQMLGEIDEPLRDALGIDVLGVWSRNTMFGFENTGWKPFTMFDGTEVLVPQNFNLTDDTRGGYYIHPQGDTSVPPSGRMPKNGFYFDAICRQEPVDDARLNPADNLEEFTPLAKEDLDHFKTQALLAAQKQKGAILIVPGAAFGDIALVPAPWMKRTRGIRDIEEWYISTLARRDYVYQVFETQCQIALENIKHLSDTLADSVQAAFITGTDFGTQRGLFISPQTYRDLYKPFHKTVNDYIHQHTSWKTFIHSCGSVVELIPEFIDAGFDILNPVQCSAEGMDPAALKRKFGKDLVFWGGAVDTQKTLPFGTPHQVYEEVRRRIDIFNRDGGFVFNAIHNVQAATPVENLLALFKAAQDSAK